MEQTSVVWQERGRYLVREMFGEVAKWKRQRGSGNRVTDTYPSYRSALFTAMGSNIARHRGSHKHTYSSRLRLVEVRGWEKNFPCRNSALPLSSPLGKFPHFPIIPLARLPPCDRERQLSSFSIYLSCRSWWLCLNERKTFKTYCSNYSTKYFFSLCLPRRL